MLWCKIQRIKKEKSFFFLLPVFSFQSIKLHFFKKLNDHIYLCSFRFTNQFGREYLLTPSLPQSPQLPTPHTSVTFIVIHHCCSHSIITQRPPFTLGFSYGIARFLSFDKCRMTCVHSFSIMKNHFKCFNKYLLLYLFTHFTITLVMTDLFLSVSSECPIAAMIWWLSFSHWLPPLQTIVVLWFLHPHYPQLLLIFITIPLYSQVQGHLRCCLFSFFIINRLVCRLLYRCKFSYLH